MRMTFFWTHDLGPFFFENLKIETVEALSILCGVLVVFSLMYEGIKVDRDMNMKLYKINNCYYFNLGLLSELSS